LGDNNLSDEPSSVFVIYVAATPAKVWQALTDGDFTAQYFFGRRIESDWKVGSPWKLLMADGSTDSGGTVLECDPPTRLAISWRVEWIEAMRKLPEARVEYRLDACGDVTRLTVSEFHHPTIDPKYKEGGRKGWPIILSGLKTLLETGRPLPAFKLPEMPTA
jgi:uncharacterized protein YndB with AHSA1/START domain